MTGISELCYVPNKQLQRYVMTIIMHIKLTLYKGYMRLLPRTCPCYYSVIVLLLSGSTKLGNAN